METSELKLVMRHCALKERGGLQIADIKGPLSMDSLKLKMPQLLLKTPDSWLKAAVQATKLGVFTRYVERISSSPKRRCEHVKPPDFLES